VAPVARGRGGSAVASNRKQFLPHSHLGNGHISFAKGVDFHDASDEGGDRLTNLMPVGAGVPPTIHASASCDQRRVPPKSRRQPYARKQTIPECRRGGCRPVLYSKDFLNNGTL
jgi:hypothetical protein